MIFYLKINIKVSYKLVVLFQMIIVMPKVLKISKFVISLHYLTKEERDGLSFCMQINTKLSYKLIPFILVSIARPAQISQMTSLQNFCIISIKK